MKNLKFQSKGINPALKAFEILVGKWIVSGTHPQVPNTILKGRASFEWIEHGAFIIMHGEIDHELFPTNVAIFGTDNTKGEWYMLYFDERQVSRKMDVSFENGILKWWRSGPEFSQRYTFKFSDNNCITSKGEISKDGINWEPDLNLDYIRID